MRAPTHLLFLAAGALLLTSCTIPGTQTPEPAPRAPQFDQSGRKFVGWDTMHERRCTRLIYFHETVDDDEPWPSSPGELAIEYGLPEWQEPGLARLDRLPIARWRLGKDHWTNLDATFPFELGGLRFEPGYYYLFVEQHDDGCQLCLIDPARVRQPGIDAWHLNRRPLDGAIAVPLVVQQVDEVVDPLEIELLLTDPNDDRLAELVIRFGPYRLACAVRALF
ncbi:MAG: hypothetical protein KAI24_12930 [Planctomycetes bacterium]|nr:hypothetical protein [Planctomycetota bacterium]